MLYSTTCVRLQYEYCINYCLADFLESLITLIIRLYKYARYYQVRLKERTYLFFSIPTPFNDLFRQVAELSLLFPRIASYSSTGLLTCSSFEFAFRLLLRPRLTLIRLSLIRKP